MFGHHVLVVDTVIWDLGLGLTYRDNKDFHLDVGVGVVVRQGSQGEQEGPPWIAQLFSRRLDALLKGSLPQSIVDGRPEPAQVGEVGK